MQSQRSTTAGKADALLVDTHALAPVTPASLPDWAVAHVKRQEQFFDVSQVRVIGAQHVK